MSLALDLSSRTFKRYEEFYIKYLSLNLNKEPWAKYGDLIMVWGSLRPSLSLMIHLGGLTGLIGTCGYENI